MRANGVGGGRGRGVKWAILADIEIESSIAVVILLRFRDARKHKGSQGV